jgi:hypothetical protein
MKKRRLYFEHSFVLRALTIFFVSVRALDDHRKSPSSFAKIPRL